MNGKPLINCNTPKNLIPFSRFVGNSIPDSDKHQSEKIVLKNWWWSLIRERPSFHLWKILQIMPTHTINIDLKSIIVILAHTFMIRQHYNRKSSSSSSLVPPQRIDLFKYSNQPPTITSNNKMNKNEKNKQQISDQTVTEEQGLR